MHNTRLGISAGALGAAAYLAGFFGGYVVVVLLTGYVLLFEENAWLRRCVVKAAVILLFFTFLIGCINIIPDILDAISNFSSIFGRSVTIPIIYNIISFITSILTVFEKILILGLGIKATRQETIVIPAVDSLVSRFML